MTEQEQRIAIAEACGFTECRGAYWQGKRPGDNRWRNIPDYPNSLDAMHDAVGLLTPAQKILFAETLASIVLRDEQGLVDWGYYPGDSVIDWDAVATVLSANAEQWAEAFIRTVGELKA